MIISVLFGMVSSLWVCPIQQILASRSPGGVWGQTGPGDTARNGTVVPDIGKARMPSNSTEDSVGCLGGPSRAEQVDGVWL